ANGGKDFARRVGRQVGAADAIEERQPVYFAARRVDQDAAGLMRRAGDGLDVGAAQVGALYHLRQLLRPVHFFGDGINGDTEGAIVDARNDRFRRRAIGVSAVDVAGFTPIDLSAPRVYCQPGFAGGREVIDDSPVTGCVAIET